MRHSTAKLLSEGLSLTGLFVRGGSKVLSQVIAGAGSLFGSLSDSVAQALEARIDREINRENDNGDSVD